MKHYGNAFLQLLKNDGLHGSFFGFEQYEQLAACNTAADFRLLLADTDYKETDVVEDVQETYSNFRLVAKAVEQKKLGSAIGQMGISGIV